MQPVSLSGVDQSRRNILAAILISGKQPRSSESEMAFIPGPLLPGKPNNWEPNSNGFGMPKTRMRSDGRLNYQERARLHRMQDNAGRRIYQQGHDNQVYSGHPNNHEPRYRHWQDNQRRHHRQANHFRRENGCDRRSAFHGNRGGFSPNHNRNRRFAWN